MFVALHIWRWVGLESDTFGVAGKNWSKKKTIMTFYWKNSLSKSRVWNVNIVRQIDIYHSLSLLSMVPLSTSKKSLIKFQKKFLRTEMMLHPSTWIEGQTKIRLDREAPTCVWIWTTVRFYQELARLDWDGVLSV